MSQERAVRGLDSYRALHPLRCGGDFSPLGFGGIGGMLRYRVDFAAMDYEPGEFDDVDLDDYM